MTSDQLEELREIAELAHLSPKGISVIQNSLAALLLDEYARLLVEVEALRFLSKELEFIE